MNSFPANTDVTVEVPLQDASGMPISVDSINYRVIDTDGTELVALTALSEFVADSDSASVTVSAGINTLPAGQVQAMRQVILECAVGINTMRMTTTYIVRADEILVLGVNSFMSYLQAEFVALTMPALEGWNGATEQSRNVALIEAWRRLLRLRYSRISRYVDQSSLFYASEGVRSVSWISRDGISGDLSLLLPAQYATLPVDFMAALRNAQLAEADSILNGDSTIEQKRREGMIQDNIGESRQMFRVSKPLELPVSRAALNYLSGYVSLALRIGRA